MDIHTSTEYVHMYNCSIYVPTDITAARDIGKYVCYMQIYIYIYMAVCQNPIPLVNIKIAGKWMFIPLKMVLIGIDP